MGNTTRISHTCGIEGGQGGGEGNVSLSCVYTQCLPHPTTQSAGYQEDFNEERKDREKAHSKMADMEMQYKHQLSKLGEELMVSRQHCERLKEEASKLQASLGRQRPGSTLPSAICVDV